MKWIIEHPYLTTAIVCYLLIVWWLLNCFMRAKEEYPETEPDTTRMYDGEY